MNSIEPLKSSDETWNDVVIGHELTRKELFRVLTSDLTEEDLFDLKAFPYSKDSCDDFIKDISSMFNTPGDARERVAGWAFILVGVTDKGTVEKPWNDDMDFDALCNAMKDTLEPQPFVRIVKLPATENEKMFAICINRQSKGPAMLKTKLKKFSSSGPGTIFYRHGPTTYQAQTAAQLHLIMERFNNKSSIFKSLVTQPESSVALLEKSFKSIPFLQFENFQTSIRVHSDYQTVLWVFDDGRDLSGQVSNGIIDFLNVRAIVSISGSDKPSSALYNSFTCQPCESADFMNLPDTEKRLWVRIPAGKWVPKPSTIHESLISPQDVEDLQFLNFVIGREGQTDTKQKNYSSLLRNLWIGGGYDFQLVPTIILWEGMWTMELENPSDQIPIINQSVCTLDLNTTLDLIFNPPSSSLPPHGVDYWTDKRTESTGDFKSYLIGEKELTFNDIENFNLVTRDLMSNMWECWKANHRISMEAPFFSGGTTCLKQFMVEVHRKHGNNIYWVPFACVQDFIQWSNKGRRNSRETLIGIDYSLSSTTYQELAKCGTIFQVTYTGTRNDSSALRLSLNLSQREENQFKKIFESVFGELKGLKENHTVSAFVDAAVLMDLKEHNLVKHKSIYQFIADVVYNCPAIVFAAFEKLFSPSSVGVSISSIYSRKKHERCNLSSKFTPASLLLVKRSTEGRITVKHSVIARAILSMVTSSQEAWELWKDSLLPSSSENQDSIMELARYWKKGCELKEWTGVSSQSIATDLIQEMLKTFAKDSLAFTLTGPYRRIFFPFGSKLSKLFAPNQLLTKEMCITFPLQIYRLICESEEREQYYPVGMGGMTPGGIEVRSLVCNLLFRGGEAETAKYLASQVKNQIQKFEESNENPNAHIQRAATFVSIVLGEKVEDISEPANLYSEYLSEYQNSSDWVSSPFSEKFSNKFIQKFNRGLKSSQDDEEE